MRRGVYWTNVSNQSRHPIANQAPPFLFHVNTFVQLFGSSLRGLLQTQVGLHMSTKSTRLHPRRISFRPVVGLSLAAPLLLAGCSHAPEYSIFGSFFPAWIFCSAVGAVLAAGARVLIARTAIAQHLAAPVLFYLSMAIFIACVLWLMFYS